jgi:hypothetical protein
MPTRIRPVLSGIIDYAGLFPPAALDMTTAARNYASYRNGDHKDLLGRFVVPADRLDELARAVDGLLERGDGSAPWCLSLIARDDIAAARKAMLEFTVNHTSDSASGHALCDAVEFRAQSAEQIAEATEVFPASIRLFFEIAPGAQSRELLEMVAKHDGAAKIRTGGVTGAAFPSAASIVGFVATCNELGVPFKATAGLHHPLWGSYSLTYDANSARWMMFGYLNLFLAAAFIKGGIDEGDARKVLEEGSADSFDFRNGGVSWRGNTLGPDDLRATRDKLFLSFGSCSFIEPIKETRALGLI